MDSTALVFLISIIFVAFLVFALSITLIRKGHNIQSEVGENDEMIKRGLKCTSREMIEEEKALGLIPEDCEDTLACGAGHCNTCDTHPKKTTKTDTEV